MWDSALGERGRWGCRNIRQQTFPYPVFGRFSYILSALVVHCPLDAPTALGTGRKRAGGYGLADVIGQNWNGGTMRGLWNGFKIAFAMYSKIPMPKADWEKENMRYMMCFFPLIGIVIGGGIVLWSRVAKWLEAGSLLRAVGYVLIPVAVTGGIHLDGLLDTADALSSYQPRERKLEILKDSHAGAFAVIMACCYFAGSLGLWSELSGMEVWVLAGGFVLSRALSGYAVAAWPSAKKSGTVAMFADAAQKRIVEISMLVLMVFSVGYMCFMDMKLGLAAVAGAGLTFLYYFRMSRKQFGGITGDLAGFFLQICELVMAGAVYLAGRW